MGSSGRNSVFPMGVGMISGNRYSPQQNTFMDDQLQPANGDMNFIPMIVPETCIVSSLWYKSGVAGIGGTQTIQPFIYGCDAAHALPGTRLATTAATSVIGVGTVIVDLAPVGGNFTLPAGLWYMGALFLTSGASTPFKGARTYGSAMPGLPKLDSFTGQCGFIKTGQASVPATAPGSLSAPTDTLLVGYKVA